MTQPMELENCKMTAKNWYSVKLRDKFASMWVAVENEIADMAS
jgi:hypothetical protein